MLIVVMVVFTVCTTPDSLYNNNNNNNIYFGSYMILVCYIDCGANLVGTACNVFHV